MYSYPTTSLLTKGISLIKNIKWGTLLDGTGKTLGVINQAIPIVYQVKPIVSNVKTLFKIANVINTPDSNETIINNNQTNKNSTSPIFYV